MKRLSTIALVSGLSVSLAACGAGEPDEFTVTGTVTAKDTGRYQYSVDCAVDDGDQVVIKDASGSDLAVGTLNEISRDTKGCEYLFTVPNVKAGESIYQMSIGGIEAPRQSEDELKSGVSLSLGR